MKTDVNGKELKVGDKVHPLGKGNKILYIIELGENCAGVSSDKNTTNCTGLSYDRIVKLKNQNCGGIISN